MTAEQVEAIVDATVAPDERCSCCGEQAAEVLVPVGEAALSTCWRCAHVICEHEVEPAKAPVAACDCPAENIYPGWS